MRYVRSIAFRLVSLGDPAESVVGKYRTRVF